MTTTKHTTRLRSLFLSIITCIALCGLLGWGIRDLIRDLLFPPTDVCSSEERDGKRLLDLSQVYPTENNIELVGHWGGEAESVFVRGDILFAKLGLELAAFDVQNPATPRRIGYFLIPGELIYVDEPGHSAYIHSAGDSSGLWKVDVSNPTQISASHLYKPPEYSHIKSIRLSAEKAFITTQRCEYMYFFEGSIQTRCDETLHVVDVIHFDLPTECYQESLGDTIKTFPTSPELIVTPKTARQGSYLYAAEEKEGLKLYDASNPIQPVEVSTYASPSKFINIFVYKTQAFATSVEDAESNKRTRYALQAFDVETPQDPKYEGELSSNPIAIAEFDHYVVLKEQFAYGRWPLGVEILDISRTGSSNVFAPPQLAQLVDMVVLNKRGYGLTNDNRFLLMDISNIKDPVILSSYTLSSPYYPGYEVSVMGNYAYIIISDVGMKILNISDEANITEIATYQMKTTPVAITVQGRYAYIAEWYGTLEIVDISDPTRPTRVQVYDAEARINDMYIVKNHLFATGGDPGLQIVDISNPAAPHLVGSFHTGTFVTGLDIECPYIYISDIENGLFVLKSNLVAVEDCQ